MISIIIVNYFQKDLLQNCLSSVYSKIHSYPFEVIVINNSAEEDISFPGNLFPDIKIIVNGNYGLANGNNLGVTYSSGEYLLFLNPDTELKTDPLYKLIPEFEKTNFGAAGLKLYNADGSFQLSFGSDPDFNGETRNRQDRDKFSEKDMDHILEKEYSYGSVRFVDWVSSTAFFIRKEVLQKAGGWNDKFILFYEDADLCRRLRDSGYPVFFFPFTKIVHFRTSVRSKKQKAFIRYNQKRSQLLYFIYHLDRSKIFLLRAYTGVKYFLLFMISMRPVFYRMFKLAFISKAKLQK